jgi:hypothetical protein
MDDRRDKDILLAEPQQNLANRLEFGELAKNQRDTVLDTTVGSSLEAIIVGLLVADGDGGV